MNLAIISPLQDKYSETFIKAHRSLNANIFFYYGGFLPTHLEGEGTFIRKGIRFYLFILRKYFFKQSIYTYNEKCLLDSFKKNNIQVVLAEYGPSGAEVTSVCKDLGISLIVYFYGFDASVIDLLENYKSKYAHLFSYAYKVIAISNKMRQDLEILGCPKDKLELCICGPQDLFFEVDPTFKNQQFISIGRFVEKKAPHLTILAFKNIVHLFPEAKLKMVGDGDLFGVCKNLVTALRLDDSVEFLGPIKPEEIVVQYKNSLAFVLHSVVASNGDSEGTPVAILEASAAGLPIISTFHAGIPDVVINGETGFLVNELDVDSMSKRMIDLIANPNLAYEMGRKGRSLISQKYTMKLHLDKLNKILSESLVS